MLHQAANRARAHAWLQRGGCRGLAAFSAGEEGSVAAIGGSPLKLLLLSLLLTILRREAAGSWRASL